MLDKKGEEIGKLISVVAKDQENMKISFDDKVDDIKKNLEINIKE